MTLHIRPVKLDDTAAVSALFQSKITVWQRLDARGQVQDVPYSALTIYERWLHGGPWMSVETTAIHLSGLLRGAGLAFAAERDGTIIGYSEAYHGVEPAPFGDHLHLAQMVTCAGGADAAEALMRHWLDTARAAQCQQITAAIAPGDEAAAFYAGCGFKPLARMARLSIPAKIGQVFYRVSDHLSANPAQIAEWLMPLGRVTSARCQWETLWPRTWHSLPEIREQRAHRLYFSAAGLEAFIYCQQRLYDPRSADLYVWTPKTLSPQIITAVRDWAHKEGYRTLMTAADADTLKILGADAEPDGTYTEIHAVAL